MAEGFLEVVYYTHKENNKRDRERECDGVRVVVGGFPWAAAAAVSSCVACSVFDLLTIQVMEAFFIGIDYCAVNRMRSVCEQFRIGLIIKFEVLSLILNV